MAGDINYATTELLLPFKGSADSVVFTDAAKTPKYVYATGNAKIVTAQTDPFGGSTGVASFDGTGDAMLIDGVSPFTFLHNGTSWTLSCWVKPANYSAERTIFDTTDGTSTYAGIYLAITTGRLIKCLITRADGANYIVTGSSSGAIPNDSAWHHIRVTFDHSLANTNLVFFIDGVSSGSLNKTVQVPSTTLSRQAKIGAYTTAAAGSFNGYMADLCINKGVVENTANFTTPTAYRTAYAAQVSGNITESSAITNWRVTATDTETAALVGTATTTGTTYSVDIKAAPNACNVTLAPKIDLAWKANTVLSVGKFIVPSAPDTTPHLFEVTTCPALETTGSSEPTWNLSGTTTSGNVVYTYVAPLVDPIAIGPKIPA